MADQNVIPVDAFLGNLRQIQLELRAGTITQQVRKFNGDSSKRFKDWTKDLERGRRIIEGNDERMRAWALETVNGPAADFLARLVTANPNITWAEIKQNMAARFSDHADAQFALQKLRRMKQGTGETIQTFAERILSQAEDAYPGEDLNEALIQAQLKETLIDGIKEDAIARKLIRDRPDTFERAIAIATAEQQAARSFNLRRRTEEPMDIDAINGPQQTSEAKRVQELEAKLESVLSKLDNVLQTQGTQGARRLAQRGARAQQRFEWTPDGRPICGYCRMAGHVFRECRKRQADTRGGNSMGNPSQGRGN